MNILQSVSNWYFSKKSLPYWCILIFDSIIVIVSGVIGYTIDLGFDGVLLSSGPIALALLVGLIPYIISFRLLHTYSGILRYSSFVDLQRVAVASLAGTLAFWLLGLLVGILFPGQTALLFPTFPAAFYIFVGSTLLMGLERVTVKRLFDSFHLDGAIPVAIYGTKAGGISIAKSIVAVKDKKYALQAFISDGSEMKGTYLMGKRVFLNHPGLAESLRREGVKALLVSPLKTELFRANTEMVDEFISAGIKIMMENQPEVWDGKDGSLTHNELHEVDIEDLLPRDKIEIDMEAIGKLLKGRRILITGAAGSIGSEMVRQIAKFSPAEMVLIDQAETPMHDIRMMMAREHGDIPCETIVSSITNADHMECIFSVHRPEYVFHAAAYKHVPMMEDDPATVLG